MDSCKKHWEHRVIIGVGTMANYNPFNMVDKITIGASVHFMSGNFLCLHVFFSLPLKKLLLSCTGVLLLNKIKSNKHQSKLRIIFYINK